ncbi:MULTISPECIES: BTAD domain-containing putative transcriptional regulator [Streptomyces]|uniref:BTAD domain-containing putative transcriptional regulator n=1 Tax=Streptomyces lonegramiae TaxID=3075524 RepID=A0ABU2XRM3_9ACTN|nr:BTAD domain-containing putative transcriptional regulator [Streptomyces sp. DSM 41529]MDT0548472.1 BTAD domain-containing putative transcriptional regulator [Streptomyces sp. DSM 41529]
MRFQVLGNFEVLADARVLTPTAPKLRRALALLILRHNEVVPTKALIDELWGSSPPDKALRAVHTYIYELRRGLARPDDGGQPFLQTRPSGYVVRVPESAIDLTSFRVLVEEGREARAAGDPGQARVLLNRALGLWQGSALANVDRGPLLEAHATELEESRLRALEMRIDADFQLGRHHELTGELKVLAASGPLHEGIHAKLMLALYRSGRRGEALKVFHDLRRQLIDELGLEPGPEIQRLQRSMLVGDPSLDPPPAPLRPPRRAYPPPAQLPRDTVDFTGRQAELDEAGHLLAAHGDGTGLPVVSLVGMAGVGKTATAIHLAHAVRSRYPDGQLYVPLGGSQPVPATAAEGMEHILRAIGVAPRDIPATPTGRTALFRTWSSDRRVLLVLDDADSPQQVEPLLPGGTGCAVLITSRSLLYGLRGARTVALGCLSTAEGERLLTRLIGRERTDAEPQAVAEVVRVVDGLPLAITFLGERLTAMRSVSVAHVLAKIRSAKGQHRLSEFSALGLDLYDRLDSCFRKLDGDAQAAFLRLAVIPRPLFTAGEGARALGTDTTTADVVLMRLVDTSLVEVAGERAAGRRQYRFRELVRAYALERMVAGRAVPAVRHFMGF